MTNAEDKEEGKRQVINFTSTESVVADYPLPGQCKVNPGRWHLYSRGSSKPRLAIWASDDLILISFHPSLWLVSAPGSLHVLLVCLVCTLQVCIWLMLPQLLDHGTKSHLLGEATIPIQRSGSPPPPALQFHPVPITVSLCH